MQGTWIVTGGQVVRLRTKRIGLMSIDAAAPVTAGQLRIASDTRFSLTLALQELRTGNFLLQAAARSLVTSNGGAELRYSGSGEGLQVVGRAVAGSIEVELGLDLLACGPVDDPMAQLAVSGSANLGTVNLPLPGLGTVQDFTFSVEGRLALLPA